VLVELEKQMHFALVRMSLTQVVVVVDIICQVVQEELEGLAVVVLVLVMDLILVLLVQQTLVAVAAVLVVETVKIHQLVVMVVQE